MSDGALSGMQGMPMTSGAASTGRNTEITPGNSCCRSGVPSGDHFCGGREGGIAGSCVLRPRDQPDGGCLMLPWGGTVKTMSPREGGAAAVGAG